MTIITRQSSEYVNMERDRYRLSKSTQSLLLTPLFLLFYILFAFCSPEYSVSLDPAFLVLLSFVSYILLYSFYFLTRMNRLSIPVLFSFIWSGTLYFSSFKLSSLQIKWNVPIVSYIYISPLISMFAFHFFYYPKNIISNKNNNTPKLYSLFCMIFCILSFFCIVYMIYQLGFIPALSPDINTARVKFNLPFVNVAGWSFTSVLTLLAGYGIFVLRKKKYWIYIVYCIIFYIICASRSGVIGILLYLAFLNSILKNNNGYVKLFYKKTLKHMLVLFFLFVFLGQIRMSGGNFDISEYGLFRYNNVALNWLYGYAFVNLDNLQLSISKDTPSYSGAHTFQAFNPFLGRRTDTKALNKYHYIGKFNLGTGFRPYYLDWGMIGAPIGLFFVWLIYALLSRLFKSNIIYCYVSYVSSQVSLFVIGDRFTSFIMIFSVSILLIYDFFFVKRHIS